MILHTTCNNFSIHQHRREENLIHSFYSERYTRCDVTESFFIRLAREWSERVCTRVPIFFSQNFHLLNFDALRDGIADIPQLLTDLLR